MKKGDVVEVFGFTMGGKRVSEGQATILLLEDEDKDYPESNIWSVHFDGDVKGDNYNRRQSDMTLIKEG